METIEILRKIRDICKKHETCRECSFNATCSITPEYWSDSEIEKMAKAVNSYEEEEK